MCEVRRRWASQSGSRPAWPLAAAAVTNHEPERKRHDRHARDLPSMGARPEPDRSARRRSPAPQRRPAAEPQYNNGNYVSLYATQSGHRPAACGDQLVRGLSWAKTRRPRPLTGDVFYIRGIVANTSGSLTDAPIMSFVFDERFDPDVDYAVSVDTPVLCLFYPDINEAGQPDPEHCRQTPDPGFVAGGSFFGGGHVLQPGEGFEVRLPVRVSVPKNGLADGAAARFGVHVLSSARRGTRRAVGGRDRRRRGSPAAAERSADAVARSRRPRRGRASRHRRGGRRLASLRDVRTASRRPAPAAKRVRSRHRAAAAPGAPWRPVPGAGQTVVPPPDGRRGRHRARAPRRRVHTECSWRSVTRAATRRSCGRRSSSGPSRPSNRRATLAATAPRCRGGAHWRRKPSAAPPQVPHRRGAVYKAHAPVVYNRRGPSSARPLLASPPRLSASVPLTHTHSLTHLAGDPGSVGRRRL